MNMLKKIFNKNKDEKTESKKKITIIETKKENNKLVRTGRAIEINEDAFVEIFQPIIPAEIFISILREKIYFTDIGTFTWLVPNYDDLNEETVTC